MQPGAYARQNVSDVAVGSCAPAACGTEEGRKQRAVVLGGIGQTYIYRDVGRPYGLMFEDIPAGASISGYWKDPSRDSYRIPYSGEREKAGVGCVRGAFSRWERLKWYLKGVHIRIPYVFDRCSGFGGVKSAKSAGLSVLGDRGLFRVYLQ